MTNVYINTIGNDSVDYVDWITALGTGTRSRLYVRDYSSSSKLTVFDVTGGITLPEVYLPGEGYATVPVSYVSGVLPTNGATVYLGEAKRGPTGPTGPTGATGQGVPTGGTSPQVLRKKSATNYDTEWASDWEDDQTVLASRVFG